MKKFGFVGSALIVCLAIHMVIVRYVSIFGIEPDILFLFVVACGFLYGCLLGETVGFLFGLTVDALGAQLFGLHTFIFSLAGYLAGKLRRRIDSERPFPQVVVAIGGTIIFGYLGAVLRHFLQAAGPRASVSSTLLAGIMNGILMPCVFWFAARWAAVWKIPRN